jgi:hypothetical protein
MIGWRSLQWTNTLAWSENLLIMEKKFYNIETWTFHWVDPSRFHRRVLAAVAAAVTGLQLPAATAADKASIYPRSLTS